MLYVAVMLSLFCRPVMTPVKAGLAAPNGRLVLFAVTVNVAGVTARETLALAPLKSRRIAWGQRDRESIGAGAQHRAGRWRVGVSAAGSGTGVQLRAAQSRAVNDGRGSGPGQRRHAFARADDIVSRVSYKNVARAVDADAGRKIEKRGGAHPVALAADARFPPPC